MQTDITACGEMDWLKGHEHEKGQRDKGRSASVACKAGATDQMFVSPTIHLKP